MRAISTGNKVAFGTGAVPAGVAEGANGTRGNYINADRFRGSS